MDTEKYSPYPSNIPHRQQQQESYGNLEPNTGYPELSDQQQKLMDLEAPDYVARDDSNSITAEALSFQLKKNHEDTSLILLIAGIMSSTLWFILWALYRNSPFETARNRAKIGGILFLVMILLGLLTAGMIFVMYMGILGAVLSA